MESSLQVSVEDVLEAEQEAEVEDTTSVLDEARSDKLWVSQLIQFFVSMKDFGSLLRAMDNFTLSLDSVSSAECQIIDVAGCQVTIHIFPY